MDKKIYDSWSVTVIKYLSSILMRYWPELNCSYFILNFNIILHYLFLDDGATAKFGVTINCTDINFFTFIKLLSAYKLSASLTLA